METTLTVHDEILRQLGGRMFLMMTGCKHLQYSSEQNNYLSMRLTRNNAKAKWVKIILMPDDTYKMVFSTEVKEYDKIGDFKICISTKQKILKEIEGVYDDQLQSTFTEVTGLYTHL